MKVLKTSFPEVKLIEINNYQNALEMLTNSTITYQWNVLKQYVNSQVCPFLSETDIHVKRARTIRGLYYDVAPRVGDTLIRCLRGRVFIAVVDIRENSHKYRRWQGWELSDENARQLYIPTGFAYGFLTLSDNVWLQNKTTHYVDNSCRKLIHYADSRIGIKWPEEPLYMSAQVRFAPGIEQVELEKIMGWVDEFAENESAEEEGTSAVDNVQ